MLNIKASVLRRLGTRYGGTRNYAGYIKSALIILVGLVVSYYSVSYLSVWVKENQETVMVPVPAYHIPAGQAIQAGDLTAKKMLKAALEPGIAVDVSEVAGMAPSVDLLPGEPVMKAKLISPDEALNSNEALVTVKIEQPESALGGNIKPNMAVDVLYIADKDRPPVILAENARVVSVLGEDGRQLDAQSNIAQVSIAKVAENKPQLRYVTLKVKRNESYEFTRPLTGGHVLIVQVGYASQGAGPQTQPAGQQPQAQPAAQQPQTQPTAQQPQTQPVEQLPQGTQPQKQQPQAQPAKQQPQQP